jgi:hypothetical protein
LGVNEESTSSGVASGAAARCSVLYRDDHVNVLLVGVATTVLHAEPGEKTGYAVTKMM